MTHHHTRAGLFARLSLFLLVVLGLLACGGSGQSEDGDAAPDGDVPMDGDLPMDGDTNPDGDSPTDGDTVPDGDPDAEPDEEQTPVDGDQETLPDGDADEDEAASVCPEDTPLATCFDNALPGTAGTLCQRAGGRDYLVYCEPRQPVFPTCRSTCSCTSLQLCEAGCVDLDHSGWAECVFSSDGDTDDDLEEDTDGDLPDGDEPDGDVDGDVPDGDEPDGDVEIFDCRPDVLAPNGSLPAARLITSGYYPNLTVCTGEKDWFKVEVNAGDVLDARIDFDGRRANLNLVLVDRFGQTVMASNQVSSDFEEVSVTSTYSGVYYLLVSPVGQDEAPYVLTVGLDPAVDGDDDSDFIEIDDVDIDKEEVEICQDDAYSPNHSRETAVPIAVGVRHENLRRCPGDNDFFMLDLNQGDFVTVSVEFLHVLGNLDLYIIRPDGVVGNYANSTTNNEQLSFNVLTTGIYLVEIRGVPPATVQTTYAMSITVQPFLTCPDDSYEPNNSLAEAALISAGNYTSMRLCVYNVDWFAVDIPAGNSLVATVGFDHALGNIDAALYNASQVLLAVGDSVTDNETLVYYAGAQAKRVYLEVFTAGSRELAYTLNIQIVSGQMCADDRMEPNNAFETAYPITASGTYSNLMLCGEDFDWYRFTLEAHNLLTVKVFYDPVPDPVLLTLYNPQQYGVAYHHAITGGVETFFQAPTSGTYRMEMFSFSFQDLPYTMQVSICPEDPLEPNDNYRAATYLSGNSHTFLNLAICRGNEDWFTANLAQGQVVTVTLAHDWRAGDLDLFMRDDMLNIVAAGAKPNGDEVITYAAPRLGSYYFQVKSYAGAENTYSLYYQRN